jgi:hypothetical protein
MIGTLNKAGIFFLSIGLFAAGVSLAAALESASYSYYISAAAFVCIGISGYRRAIPLHLPLREVAAQMQTQRVDAVSIAGLMLLFASLVVRYVIERAA